MGRTCKKVKCYITEARKIYDTDPMSPISGLVLIMRNTLAILYGL